MEEDNIRQLIRKFLADEISGDEIDLLKEWLAESAENRILFDQENELWQKTNYKSIFEHFDPENAWADLSGKIPGFSRRNSRAVTLTRKNMTLLITAASIALLVAVGGMTLWISERAVHKQMTALNTIISTSEGEKANIFLPDSSQITINSGSEIGYSAQYNIKERAIRLSGEAYFDVRTDAKRPFIVQAGKDIRVHATGTKFNIYSYPAEGRMETTLVDGSITVMFRDKDPIDVIPGQQVVCFSKKNEVLVKNVNPETYTSWKENKLRFIDTPFEEVLRKLGRRYNVVFEVRNTDLLELRYTATFIDESIEEVMQMLKTISPISYKIYNRTTIDDSHYVKPKIIVYKRK